MPVDRPRRSPASHLTPQIAIAILNWLRENGLGRAKILQIYLTEEAYANPLTRSSSLRIAMAKALESS